MAYMVIYNDSASGGDDMEVMYFKKKANAESYIEHLENIDIDGGYLFEVTKREANDNYADADDLWWKEEV